jgi:hypothetical protein
MKRQRALVDGSERSSATRRRIITVESSPPTATRSLSAGERIELFRAY